jgi:putative CocE/NonD family hydrolase
MLLALWCAARLAVADDFDVSAHYDKIEHRVAMRDGVKLHTIVYSPKDRSKKWPVLLYRTPYSAGPYGEGKYRAVSALAPDDAFLRAGYIVVYQEARGTYRSEGEWVDFRPPRTDRRRGTDETTDNYDTVEWILRRVPGHNGRIGQWGISNPAWYTAMGLLDPHPKLAAVSIQATTADPFVGDDYHHNGAFMQVNLSFLEAMSIATGPGRETLEAGYIESGIHYDQRWNYDFFLNAGPLAQLDAKYFQGRLFAGWDDLIAHPDYDDYWRARDFLAPIGRVRIPVLNVGGWFDAPDPYGAIATYQRIESRSPRNANTLVMGPWRHGGWRDDDGSMLGDIEFGAATAEDYRRHVIFPFFEHHLRANGTFDPAEAIVFETGANRWHRLAQWPPVQRAPRKLFLRAAAGLSFDAPGAGAEEFDEYVSDPRKPVPDSPTIPSGEFTIADQRFAYTRPDVLSYQTEVLTEDVTIAGSIPVRLFASTSGTDADFFVKLIDVYPEVATQQKDNVRQRRMGGYQMLLAYEVMRAKYRNDLAKPEPLAAGQVTPIDFELRDRFHTFRKGHRIMVQIQSSMFPLFDRNPGVFTNIYTANPEDFRATTQRVFRSGTTASHLELPVIPAGALAAGVVSLAN